MHVDVSDILHRDEGEQLEFSVENELPDLDDVPLAQPLTGRICLVRTEDGLAAAGELQTQTPLQCDRCLRTFAYPLWVKLSAVYSDRPGDDDFPIGRRGQIDLAPAVRQEIILSLPTKQLCSDDCAGIVLKPTK